MAKAVSRPAEVVIFRLRALSPLRSARLLELASCALLDSISSNLREGTHDLLIITIYIHALDVDSWLSSSNRCTTSRLSRLNQRLLLFHQAQTLSDL